MDNKSGSLKKVLVIHGPNLNLLGKREPEIYGKTTLEDIDNNLKKLGKAKGIVIKTFQSNYEGAIIDRIHDMAESFQGLIINPAAYTHTSIALRDALLMLTIPIIEIHLSNIYKRESFRHKSMIADVVSGQITGFGDYGYLMALEAMVQINR